MYVELCISVQVTIMQIEKALRVFIHFQVEAENSLMCLLRENTIIE